RSSLGPDEGLKGLLTSLTFPLSLALSLSTFSAITAILSLALLALGSISFEAFLAVSLSFRGSLLAILLRLGSGHLLVGEKGHKDEADHEAVREEESLVHLDHLRVGFDFEEMNDFLPIATAHFILTLIEIPLMVCLNMLMR